MSIDTAVNCDENKEEIFKGKPLTFLHTKYLTLMGSTGTYIRTWTDQLSTWGLDNEGELHWDKAYKVSR